MMDRPFDLRGKKVFVSGHHGMVGSALLRSLDNEDCTVLTADRSVDFRDQNQVDSWFEAYRPDAAIVAAAKVGGILANDSQPAQFLYDNLMIAANTIEAARRANVEKLLYLGSSCIYPKHAAQPIAEASLLTGPLEPTNEWYAIAKIAGIKLCQAYRREYGCDFISALPCNLYGAGDNYHPDRSHVLPALLRKAHEAKTSGSDILTVWGSGTPLREFLHVDDLASACVVLLRSYSSEEPVNVGSGEEISIRDLATLITQIVGFEGELVFDTGKPDGTPRKLMNSSKIRALGWEPSIALREGIASTYEAIRSSL